MTWEYAMLLPSFWGVLFLFLILVGSLFLLNDWIFSILITFICMVLFSAVGIYDNDYTLAALILLSFILIFIIVIKYQKTGGGME